MILIWSILQQQPKGHLNGSHSVTKHTTYHFIWSKSKERRELNRKKVNQIIVSLLNFEAVTKSQLEYAWIRLYPEKSPIVRDRWLLRRFWTLGWKRLYHHQSMQAKSIMQLLHSRALSSLFFSTSFFIFKPLHFIFSMFIRCRKY